MPTNEDTASGDDASLEKLRDRAQVRLKRARAGRFLGAIRDGKTWRAQQILAADPALRMHSLQTAAAACDEAAVATLLASGQSITSAHGASDDPIVYLCRSPLHSVNAEMAQGSVECARRLLDAGANPNTTIPLDGNSDTRIPILYFACVGNNVGVVRVLLERGANPDDGESVFHSAELNHRDCLAVLLEFGADLGSADKQYSNTPLYFIAGHKPFSGLCASSELGMQWLLEHGADPNVSSYNDSKDAERASYPLHRIAAYGKGAHVAALLVTHGAIVDAPRGDGKTAYALAVRTANTPVAEYLLTQGADPARATIADRFLGACAVADRTTARALLDSHPDLMSTLGRNDRQTLSLAAEAGKEDSVRLMAELGWDMAAEGQWGGTALHHAAWHGRTSMTRLLLSLGAPVNFRDSTFGSSPLGWAAHGSANGRPGHDDDYRAVVDLLIAAGATREASYNKWNEPPESMSSMAVAKHITSLSF